MDKFKRNYNFFKNILEKTDRIIYADDLDNQFNIVTNYLNNNLKPAIDELLSGSVKGVYGQIGAFLHNLGDGKTDWKYVDNDTINDFSISLNKIVKINSASIIAIDSEGIMNEVSSFNDNQVLISQENQIPVWDFIDGNNIEFKTLTGQQFGKLSMENFVENQFITNIVANVITTENISDLNITNEKLKDETITVEKLGIFANLPVATANLLNVNNIADGSITPDKVKDGTIPVSYNNYLGSVFEAIWGNVYGEVTVEGGWKYKQLLKSENLKDNTIEDARLPQILYLTNDKPKNQREVAAKAFFPDIPLAFQFQAEHIANDSLGINSFDAEVQAAINKL